MRDDVLTEGYRPKPPPNTPSTKGEPAPPPLRKIKDGESADTLGAYMGAFSILCVGFLIGGIYGVEFTKDAAMKVGTREGLRMMQESNDQLDRALALYRKAKTVCEETPPDVEL